MKKEFGNLSEFSKETVTLYRCPENESLMIVSFKNRFGSSTTFVKYPSDDYYTKLISGGYSSQGDKINFTATDVWKEKYSSKIECFQKSNNMMIKFGSDFYFLSRTTISEDYIDNLLTKQYLKIPLDVRTIEYGFKYSSGHISSEPVYFLTDFPAYDFSYQNHRLFKIKGDDVKEFNIVNFERYRDGGTTYITFIDDNNIEHKLFSPTPFNKNISATLDEIDLDEITEEEKSHLVKLLGIETVKKD